MSINLLYAIPVAGLLALIFAFIKTSWISKQPDGNETMKEIASHIRGRGNGFFKQRV